jgi:hypothetical protein
MQHVKKITKEKDISEALEYIESYWHDIDRVRVMLKVEIGINCSSPRPLEPLVRILGGRIQHRKNGYRWYLRPTVPSYKPFLEALTSRGWKGIERLGKTPTPLHKRVKENTGSFERMKDLVDNSG